MSLNLGHIKSLPSPLTSLLYTLLSGRFLLTTAARNDRVTGDGS